MGGSNKALRMSRGMRIKLITIPPNRLSRANSNGFVMLLEFDDML
jgi:hypothetical protein